MEYIIFAIGICALVVSVVISQTISQRNREEFAVLKAELTAHIDIYTNTRLQNSHNYFQGQYDHLNLKFNETIVEMNHKLADAIELEDHIEHVESRINDVHDNVSEIENNYVDSRTLEEKIDDHIHAALLPAYDTKHLKELASIIVENDDTLLNHLDNHTDDYFTTIDKLYLLLYYTNAKDKRNKATSTEAVPVPTNTRKRTKRIKDAPIQGGI